MDKGKGKEGAQDTLPWVEKYRPSSLEQVMSHQYIISTWTGKTSTIMALAARLYGKSFRNNVLELNASDDRGIDVVRGQIKAFASTRNVFSTQSDTFKLVILDEADAMTQAAQAALRRVMEQYTRNVRFCIICNYVNKIIPAIQSRCTRFRFSPLDRVQVERRLDTVVAEEHCRIDAKAKDAILQLSHGDMRRVLNILQACDAACGPGEVIDEDSVYNCTGHPHPQDIETAFQAMLEAEFTSAYETIQRLRVEKGTALTDLLTGVHELVMTLELAPSARVYILDHMADIEYRLSTNATERIQLSTLIASIKAGIELGTGHDTHRETVKAS